MVAIFVVGCGAAVAVQVANGSFSPDSVALPLAFTGFMVVGAVIVAHRPGNAVGWIFSAVGLLAATGWLAVEYAAYAYITRPGSVPGAIWAAWYWQPWWIPMYTLVFVATPLLFRSGRPSSCRTRTTGSTIPSGWPGSPTLTPARSAASWGGCSLAALWRQSSR